MRHRNLRTTCWAVLPWATALLAVSACQEPEPPPAAYIGPTLACADLGLTAVTCPATGYAIIESQSSQGRFPGALAVARLVPADGDAGADDALARPWQLGTIKEEKATYWTALFNTVAAIREVVILDTPAVERPEADLNDITIAGRRQKADLCLIWGPCAADPDRAALMGVIMDTDRVEPVAFVQAEAGPEDFKPPAADGYTGDRRHEDVNYLAARKFEQQVKECMFELIARDRQVATTQPSPWKSATTLPFDDRAVPVYIIPNRPTGW